MNAKTILVLGGTFCLLLGMLRGDCRAPLRSSQERVQLNFWNGFTGPDGVVMLELVREFNLANPDIQVSMQRMDWATYYNKVMVAVLDERGPEVFVLQANSLPRMHRAGLMQPINDAFEGDDGIPVSDFDAQVISQVEYGKDRIGVPLDIWPFGLYLNRDLLEKAGIERPPTNKEEFLAAARAMRRDQDHDGSPDEWGFALTDWRLVFQTLAPQFGGHYFDANGRADLVNEGNIRTLEFMVELNKATDRLVPPPENGLGWMGFRQQKVGMVIDGIYMLGDLMRLQDFRYQGAPVPIIGDRPGTLADSHVLCVRRSLSEAKRVASIRFIQFLSKKSIKWAGAGQVPARKSVRALGEFGDMQVQAAFAKQIAYLHYFPRTINIFELNQELGLAIEQVIRGRKSPDAALKFANQKFQASLDRTEKEASP